MQFLGQGHEVTQLTQLHGPLPESRISCPFFTEMRETIGELDMDAH